MAAGQVRPVDVLAEQLVNFLSGRPVNREATIGAAQDFAKQWAGGIGADYRPDIGHGSREDTVHRRAQAGGMPGVPWYAEIFMGRQPGAAPGAQRPPPPPNAREVEELRRIAAARQILGFTPTESLTEDAVNKAHRALIKRNHPDHGKNDADRARRAGIAAQINSARDVLLATL